MLTRLVNRWATFLTGRPYERHDLLVFWNPIFVIPVLVSKMLDKLDKKGV